jgi:hypothetical protein
MALQHVQEYVLQENTQVQVLVNVLCVLKASILMLLVIQHVVIAILAIFLQRMVL